ncbi:MAG: KamA family radical SAM protein [Patescibacteria group bacterium]
MAEPPAAGTGGRFQALKQAAEGYLAARDGIPIGRARQTSFEAQRKRLQEYYGASDADWQDWRWQMAHRIDRLAILSGVLGLALHPRIVDETLAGIRWAITPYFAALLDPISGRDPLRLQAVPSLEEITDARGETDPMDERGCSPCPLVVRRYPDRLIVKVTNACAMYCRHCQRRCVAGSSEQDTRREEFEAALGYIAANPEIRDVLITGGDPLALPDETLAWLLDGLDAIPHVEIKRIGSRMPVTLPQRVTDDLCRILRTHQPIYLNTQFNSPLEVTAESSRACRRLADAGVVLGNQSVLLRGVNDDPYVMRRLLHELLKLRVRPYYLFHAKPVRGACHFATTIDKGLEIMDDLRGRTSGLAIPSYVVNAPGGLGKVPLLPSYIVSRTTDSYVLRTWEGRLVRVPNGPPGTGRAGGE